MVDGAVSVVGLQGGEWFSRRAGASLFDADVVIGARRHLDALAFEGRGERVCYRSVDELVDLVKAHLAGGRRVVVLASGDPGFFGAVRVLGQRFAGRVEVHPAPSAVALAFARLGLAWDDAVVVSAHGRSLDAGIAAVAAADKVAVLTSPETRPEDVGRALLGLDAAATRHVWVCTRLGEVDEAVVATDLGGLAAGSFDPLAVTIVVRPDVAPRPAAVVWDGGAGAPTATAFDHAPSLSFGRPVDEFAHREGMITKPEVRAVVLGKLDLFAGATLWDVGAGSGSVAVEAARLAPGLRAWAIERRPEDCRRIERNARALAVTVVEGEAPDCLEGLPAPDRAFVGGGGIDVLDAVCARLAPGAAVVAAFATMERAVAGAARLGHLVQIGVNRAEPIGADGTLRLAADNPVFVAWGTPR